VSNTSEKKVAELLQKILSLEFSKNRDQLGRWGEVDRVSKVCSNKYVFLEVEEGQTHPDTNVLKVWPYLEENRRVRIFLIQVFLPKCLKKCQSRVLLSEWTGGKLATRFPKRFRYCRINLDGNFRIVKGKRLLEREFNEFCSEGRAHR
jgi:hypothetical protein